MAKNLFLGFAILFVSLVVADAARARTKKQVNEELTKCVAEGSGDGRGMMISWGSAKPIKECGPTTSDGHGLNYEYQFTNAFTVSLDKRCICQVEGKTIATFRPINLAQAQKCAGKTVEEDPVRGIKSECWEAYKRGRGTRFRDLGDMKYPEYKVPWSSSNFVISKPATCIGEDCNSITLPGVLDGMSRNDKRIIGDAIKKIMEGKTKDVPGVIQKMIEILPPDALDDAEFEHIDENGDGTLSVDELTNFYEDFNSDHPNVIEKFVKDVDDNGNGEIDRDEFAEFKKKMRDYDPSVDLIDGQLDFIMSPSGEVRETKPEWKVATLKCMKGGNEVDASECKVEEADAIIAFNNEC